MKIVIFFSEPRCCIAWVSGSMGGMNPPPPTPLLKYFNLNQKVIIMKFLIVLVVIAIVTLKAVFGMVDVAADTVYEGSHKTEQVLNDLEL